MFSFKDFEEFNTNYFKKDLVAFDQFYKMRQLKYARVKYNKRFGEKGGPKVAITQGYEPSAMMSSGMTSKKNEEGTPIGPDVRQWTK